jgi:hypothetical protein
MFQMVTKLMPRLDGAPRRRAVEIRYILVFLRPTSFPVLSVSFLCGDGGDQVAKNSPGRIHRRERLGLGIENESLHGV